MAAASGPVETSSGKAAELNEFIPPQPPEQRQVTGDNEENSANEFKVPDANTLPDRKKPEPEPQASNNSKAAGNESGAVEHKKRTQQSGAEQLKHSQTSVPYKEPIWGGVPPECEKYSFDVLKNGTVIDSVELGKKPWVVFGRLPSCDVSMEHPSLSRYHAVVQYRELAEEGNDCGWYLYDLDSTHGTWVNKEKIKPKIYRRLHVGHVLKFGGSSRLYILQGPEKDQEPEIELSVTELKQQTAKLKREADMLKQAEMEEEEEREKQQQKIQELRGCSWGMGEDAVEEDETPFSVTGLVPEHEHLYKDDPKKALKGFYDREGCDLPDYQFTEVGFGKHKCVVELPVDGPNGEVLIAEATVSGKKKDAVVACALEACRLLDIHGMLHASKHESRKRKTKNWEDDDFYDSDEDTFLDRTGTIEKKRIFRMKKCGKEEKAETYESLVSKHEEVQKTITEIEFKLEQAKAQSEAAMGEEDDALDAYMTAIRAGVMDTKTRLSLKRQLLTLRTDEQRLRKLVNVARPTDMPELKKLDSGVKKAAAAGLSSGTRKIGMSRGPKKPVSLPVAMQSTENKVQEEEEEEEEEDADNKETKETLSSPASQLTHDSTVSQPRPETEDSGAAGRETQTAEGRQKSSVLASVKQLASKTPSSKRTEIKTSDCKLKGPTLPSTGDVSSVNAESEREKLSAAVKHSAPRLEAHEELPVKRKKKPVAAKPRKVEYDESDPDYAMWMPPQNQSGDGRTSLNDKLGY